MSDTPCIFGEVLFDHFPDGRRVLGGAPFNVAWHLRAFGEQPFLVSRVGEDEDGEEVQRAMRAWGMDRAGLQADPNLPTGRVQVRFDDGEPSYDIVFPSAWDAIEEPDCPAGGCALLYHGSLALRDKTSRRACETLRAKRPAIVFIDVNLRPPWFRPDRLLKGLEGAHWVKLNRHELDELALGGGPADRRARDFLARHDLRGLVLTGGADGASVLTADGERWEARPEANVPVVDTVGAGDALAAVMILGLLRGWPLGASLERAQSFASAVVGQRGATIHEPGVYADFMNAWSQQAAQFSGRGPAT